ncbi:SDR family oxidoreductase [Achromobacter aegrifaciens]
MFSPDLLNKKVAFVTGGATGIGLEISRLYASLGASVVIASRKEDNLDKARKLLVEETGGTVVAIKADVRDYSQVQGAIAQTVSEFGTLDILVNNAAGNFPCPTSELSSNGWRTVVDIDLNGTFHCCHAAYSALKKSKGVIINITATQGFTGWPGAAHAASAKAGIIALARTLAVEWGSDQIRVNNISPGPIADTEGMQRLYEQRGLAEEQRRRTALGRLGSKADIANAAAFLASPLAAYITGADLIVDGGRWLKYVAS